MGTSAWQLIIRLDKPFGKNKTSKPFPCSCLFFGKFYQKLVMRSNFGNFYQELVTRPISIVIANKFW